MSSEERTYTLDPVTFEVIKNAFSTAVDLMAEQILRTCHSFVIYARDFSSALCDREGNTIMQGSQDIAGSYFNKIECFCFTEQRLEPGQSVDMPVVYFIDPAILDDPQASKISEITLSYTFYKVDNPAKARQQVTGATEPAVGATRI